MSKILDAISDGQTEDLLFHGTCETFELPPRPGTYDGVLWTAKDARIAQSYIPSAGLKLIGYQPSAYELQEKIKPAEQSFWHLVAKNMGSPAADVEVDEFGRLISWVLPQGWPSYSEAQAWLENKGYTFDTNGIVSVLARNNDEVTEIMPADWKLPGRLLITSACDLRFYDHAAGREGDLMDLDYHNLELFREVEKQGYDGIIIHDFLQDDTHGNVGHLSYGIFEQAAKHLDWIEIPAINREWDSTAATTPEFMEFQEQAQRPTSAKL